MVHAAQNLAISTGVLVALAAAIGALMSPALPFFGHEHEMNEKMVELGVDAFTI